MSPSTWSAGTNQGAAQGELRRVCEDVCKLMTCECLKKGLRAEGLQVSGVTDALARRLAGKMVELSGDSASPTIRQWRYVFWLWRHRDLHGRHVLHYYEVNNKERTSALISQWDQM